MKRPRFSREQLAYLRDLLTPRCCHVTGMHDPQHFDDKKYVCELQMSTAYLRARHDLGFGKPKPADAVPVSDCGWCASDEHKKYVRKRHRRQRSLDGRAPTSR